MAKKPFKWIEFEKPQAGSDQQYQRKQDAIRTAGGCGGMMAIMVALAGLLAIIRLLSGGGEAQAEIPEEAQIAAAKEIRKDHAVRSLMNDQPAQIWTISSTPLTQTDAQAFAAYICTVLAEKGAALSNTKVKLHNAENGDLMAEKTCIETADR